MPKKMSDEVAERTTAPIRPWLTTLEMCAVLNVDRHLLSKLIAEGEVRATRLRNQPKAPYRFHPDEPERYFAANAVEPAARAS